MNGGPAASNRSKASSGRPCCRSPHGSSVASPADIVISCRIVTGGESVVGGSPAGERGHVITDRVVEAEPALVAEQEQRRGREALGHRRDPVHGVRVGTAVLAVADRPRAAGVDEGAVADDAPRDPGDPRLLAESFEPCVERRQQVVEGGHATMMPDRPPAVGAGTCACGQSGPPSTNTRNASTSRKPMAA